MALNRLQCGRFTLSLERPLVMGVVNVTPDSFSDGRADYGPSQAIEHAHQLAADGADLLDIGGESTRPGASPLPLDEELRRVLPVVQALRDLGIPLSVDTRHPDVMRRVLDHGADMINDITAFGDPLAVQAVRDSGCGLCVMHMQGDPQTMQRAPHYNDVVAEIRDFLDQRRHALEDAGIEPGRLVLDPGFGFGKTAAQNYVLLAGVGELSPSGLPLLVGVSRKSMIGHVTGREPAQRVAGSIAAALAAVARGASILRVHDVRETVDALRVWQAIEHKEVV